MKYSAFVVMPLSKGLKLEKSPSPKSKVLQDSDFQKTILISDFTKLLLQRTSHRAADSRQQTADGLSDGIPSHTPAGYFRSL